MLSASLAALSIFTAVVAGGAAVCTLSMPPLSIFSIFYIFIDNMHLSIQDSGVPSLFAIAAAVTNGFFAAFILPLS